MSQNGTFINFVFSHATSVGLKKLHKLVVSGSGLRKNIYQSIALYLPVPAIVYVAYTFIVDHQNSWMSFSFIVFTHTVCPWEVSQVFFLYNSCTGSLVILYNDVLNNIGQEVLDIQYVYLNCLKLCVCNKCS